MSKQFLQTHTIPDAHITDIFSLAVTPTALISASGSSSIKIHSTATGTQLHADSAVEENPFPLSQTLEKAHALGCHHVCAAAEGKVFATSGFEGDVKVWEVKDGGEEWTLRGTLKDDKAGEQWALALSPDGLFLAATTHDGRVNVYEISKIVGETKNATKFVQFETKGSFGMCVDISPNGEMTASGHQNGSVYIFNNATKRLVHSLGGLVKPVRAVAFSPANKYLAAAGDARLIALYDTQSGKQVANLTGHSSWIMSLSWNWSGEYLLSGSYDGKAKIWSLDRRECVATQTESEKCLWSVKWLPKSASARNEMFVAAGAGRSLSFYREASGT
nr:hypothetical protein B0A51_01951 [Rachicladosporium sp. CCFEE 5018]